MNNNGALIEIPSPSESAAARPTFGARLPAFMGGPADAIKRLTALKVLVVGSGSVGLEFAQHLARWQVQELAIVDPKRFKRESLLTHSIPPEAVGESKAFYAARLAKRISPLTRVSAVQGKFESINLAELARFDVVFIATDGPLPELKVSQACRTLGIQTVQGSVHGESITCQVRFASHSGTEAPCAACAFTRDEWARMGTVFSCTGSAQPEGPPTMSLSALCSLAAQMGLLQFARHVLALGEPVRDTVLEYCAYTHRTVLSRLARNPDCPCDHAVWRRIAPARPLRDCTLRELQQAAGGAEASFEIDSHVWVEQGRCECGAWRTHRRFVNGGSLGECGECRRPIRAHPFHSHRVVPGGEIDVNQPLHALGATDARWVVVRGPNAAAVFLDSEQP